MKSRNVVIPLFSFLFVVLLNTALFADDSLKPFLINLKGWQGEAPQAMNMDMNGVQMINAVRSYESGDKSIAATVMVTSLQMGMASFQQMNMSQGEVKVSTTEMNGFKVMHTHDGNEHSGNIVVLLGETEKSSALFSLGYEGLSDKDSLALAKKFDWKGMGKTAKKLMK